MKKYTVLFSAFSGIVVTVSATAQEPMTVAKDPDFELFQRVGSEDVKNNIWTNLLSIADQSFSGDNDAVNLDFQDDIYRLTFDLGTKKNVKPGRHQVTFTTFSMKGSIPLSGTQNASALPTLNELSNGSTIELQFSKSYVPMNRDIWNPERFNDWKSSTKAAIIEGIQANTVPNSCKATVAGFYIISYGFPGIDDSNRAKAVSAMSEQEKLFAYNTILESGDLNLQSLLAADAALVETCAPGVFDQYWRNHISSAWREGGYNQPGWAKTFGVGAKLGQEEFTFKDIASFEDMAINETTYAFNAFARLERGNDLGGQSLSASVELQHAFKENNASTECQNPEDLTTCVEAIFGPPQAQDSFVAKVSYSSVLKEIVLMGSQPIAFSLNANYNIDEDIWGLEAPVFLYRNDENLGAGVRAGWRSDTDNFEVGFFVSQKFSFN